MISNDLQKLPNKFQAYLGNSTNKINLVNYVFEKWKTAFSESLCNNQLILMANLDGTVTRCTYNQFTTLDWTCDHEEADSKMFVFCKHLLEQYHVKRIIICSPDNDVAVICCYHHITTLSTLDTLWFKTRTGNKRGYITIHESTTSLGSSICRILPALHCITGCDSVSSFSGIGKKSGLSVLKSNIDQLVEMFEFGESSELMLQEPVVEACIKFVCLLYDKKSTLIDINALRHKLFTQKNISGDKLPPILDALVLHLRRANYQCHIESMR